jgi:hypothetical protein
LASFFFARLLNALTAAGPFRIKKKLLQNNPTDALTKRLSHEFRNKIERPRAINVMPLITTLRSPCDAESGLLEIKFIGLSSRI